MESFLQLFRTSLKCAGKGSRCSPSLSRHYLEAPVFILFRIDFRTSFPIPLFINFSSILTFFLENIFALFPSKKRSENDVEKQVPQIASKTSSQIPPGGVGGIVRTPLYEVFRGEGLRFVPRANSFGFGLLAQGASTIAVARGPRPDLKGCAPCRRPPAIVSKILEILRYSM